MVELKTGAKTADRVPRAALTANLSHTHYKTSYAPAFSLRVHHNFSGKCKRMQLANEREATIHHRGTLQVQLSSNGEYQE